jgi:hypothetical protein
MRGGALRAVSKVIAPGALRRVLNGNNVLRSRFGSSRRVQLEPPLALVKSHDPCLRRRGGNGAVADASQLDRDCVGSVGQYGEGGLGRSARDCPVERDRFKCPRRCKRVVRRCKVTRATEISGRRDLDGTGIELGQGAHVGMQRCCNLIHLPYSRK